MNCEHDLTSLIGLDAIDTLLGSVGAIMRKFCVLAAAASQPPARIGRAGGTGVSMNQQLDLAQ